MKTYSGKSLQAILDMSPNISVSNDNPNTHIRYKRDNKYIKIEISRFIAQYNTCKWFRQLIGAPTIQSDF